ncbi:hypothetical protein LTR56_003191 [Elasticomyces elasticus]|nr:hypothetical protein LTR22_010724 [Elasticomyces elasticus]KAK3656059.1 hypothetical protein LTR56_003191 [Elasticomyces elasticus]KAK4920879.1 hypothetical protein LTR49_011601 [Elasticomyces elasticus]KAK5759605.1 hypothetical protein LTS12_010298 [Elasticomyces elasticus]
MSAGHIYVEGEVVPSHFSPGIVAASYFASLCGCLLTIELLHRRGTALGNLRSWLETLGCATSMGLVGIWCMHFIGNRAIVLANGDSSMQLVYNSGYTTLSVFLPIIGLTMAFSAAEYPSRSKRLHWCLLVCTGTFAGLSVVGMHYIGNFGVTNYRLQYVPRFLTASIIIAVGDCLLVLVLFYTLRERWISSWWKRLLCASLLAGGVSAMHFTASTKCIYRFRGYNGDSAIQSRNTQVAVAGALSGLAGFIVVGVLFFTRHRSRLLKIRSQKVMLACAMFDPDGKILVTTEGVLPAREITDKYQHRTFSEDFDTAHPVFQWIFRVTRSWTSVSEQIPHMKSHLAAHSIESDDDSKPASSASSAQYDPETYSDYSIVFRERFCCAAASLAAAMHLPTDRIGVLYDKIVDTGTLRADDKLGRRAVVPVTEALDVESGKTLKLFGRGQLLFLTKQLSSDDADKLLNAGFRFASVQQVGRHIAETMQIPLPTLEYHTACLRQYTHKLAESEKSGTWLSFFGLIPRPNSKGFDVGVKKDDQDQLPDAQLLSTEPEQWQAEFLQRMDGLRTRSAMTFLEDRNNTDVQREPRQQHFASIMLHAMMSLSEQVPADWFREARFLARPVFAHYTQNVRSRGTVTWLYSFCVITDMHTSLETCNGVARIPLTFFSARQRCYKGSPDHAILARDIHQEFGPLLARRVGGKPPKDRSRRVSLHRSKTPKKFPKPSTPRKADSRSSSLGHSDSTSVHELVDFPSKMGDVTTQEERGSELESWGGILVNSETVVKSSSNSDYSNDTRRLGLGTKVDVSTARQEDTFVDELFHATRTRFVPPKISY